MSFPYLIEVFEHCLRDRTKKPMSKLGDPAISCLGRVSELSANSLIDSLLDKKTLPDFQISLKNKRVSQMTKNQMTQFLRY